MVRRVMVKKLYRCAKCGSRMYALDSAGDLYVCWRCGCEYRPQRTLDSYVGDQEV